MKGTRMLRRYATATGLALAGCFIMPQTVMAACSPTDFNIENLQIEVDNCTGRNCPMLIMTGSLVNECGQPAAARVEIQAQSRSGRPIDSVDGWPAQTSNLAPGERAEFDFTAMMPFDPSMSDFSVNIIETRVW